MAFWRAVRGALAQAHPMSSQNGCLLELQRGLAAAPGQLDAIKALRERSGAPIGEVKAALTEAAWDPEKAFQNLRKKGLAAAAKKATRRAAEGLIGLAHDTQSAVLVEVNSETDFVARTPEFRSLVTAVAEAALRTPTSSGDLELGSEALEELELSDGRRAGAAAQDVAGVLRENIRLRRGHRLSSPGGVVGHYLHISPAPGMGRMGALVALQAAGEAAIQGGSSPDAETFGKHLAMHIVAAQPRYLDKSLVPAAVLEGERDVLRQQAAKTGKPANILDKMVEGRLQKFYEDVCLVDQRYVIDDALRIREVLKSSPLGKLQIAAFVRLVVGEGMEQVGTTDFAGEVQQTVQAAS